MISFSLSEGQRERWDRNRAVGFERYVLRHGLVFGAFMFIMNAVLLAGFSYGALVSAGVPQWGLLVLISLAGGLLYGIMTWYMMEALYRRSNERR